MIGSEGAVHLARAVRQNCTLHMLLYVPHDRFTRFEFGWLMLTMVALPQQPLEQSNRIAGSGCTGSRPVGKWADGFDNVSADISLRMRYYSCTDDLNSQPCHI